ncbi:MAG: DUF2306 domain-containing protein [Bacteroidota bacterium]
MKLAARILIALLSAYIVTKSARYLDFDITGILLDKGEIVNSLLYRIMFFLHVVFGSIALLVGPWQFIKRLRSKLMRFHRFLGKIYVVSSLIGGFAGFCISFFATGGPIGKLGFAIAGILWFVLTYIAYRRVIDGDILSHEKWMIFSFAMTFAAVTLRVWLGVLIGVFGLSYINAYMTVAWLSWMPNLLVALLIVDRRKLKVLKTQNN